MDGNGRWAKNRGLPRVVGHEQGARAIGRCLEACKDAGVEFLTLYAFSSENWKRPKDEVDALMGLLRRFLDERSKEMLDKNIRLRTIGRISELPADIGERLRHTVEKSKSNTALQVVLALNYSGRLEIVDAVRSLIQKALEGKLEPSEVGPELIGEHLYTAGIPDPDLLIRTSGELRISNFLLWQLSYTEIYVTPKLWPDFEKEDFFAALEEFNRRQRRFGGVSPEPVATSPAVAS